MIYIRLRGRLGNQMFQYAAARLAAERLSCQLVVENPYFDKVSIANLLAGRSASALFDLFPHLPVGRLGLLTRLGRRVFPSATDRLVRLIAPKEFSPRNLNDSNIESNEAFDSHYFDVEKGTRLIGYFQSAKYFAGSEQRVRDWYSMSSDLESRATRVFENSGVDPLATVAVHVRLGDYRTQRNLVCDPRDGWLLSREYYGRAFARIPDGLALAVFSDEPEHAEEYIGRKGDILGAGCDQNLEFAMMQRCRFFITSNSTFSWWAAWLAAPRGQTVIAPKYFLGWRHREWFPADIMVPHWDYI